MNDEWKAYRVKDVRNDGLTCDHVVCSFEARQDSHRCEHFHVDR